MKKYFKVKQSPYLNVFYVLAQILKTSAQCVDFTAFFNKPNNAGDQMPTFIYQKIKSNFIMIVLLSVFTYSTSGYAVGGLGVITIIKSGNTIIDSDGDGVPDYKDAFPANASEWVDTDSDGIGNNADTDDDGDKIPDNWEILYGLDPLVDDASEDPDNDGLTNLAEYYTKNDPMVSDKTEEETSENIAPYQPVLVSPEDGDDDVPIVPDLVVGDFIDADEGDTHYLTQWQFSQTSDFSSLILDRQSDSVLVSAIAPGALLSSGTEYFWRVRFYDSAENVSQWSVPYSFITRDNSPVDNNEDGIPDGQEVNRGVDLDQDGRPDKYQNDILSLNNAVTDTQTGIKGVYNVAKIESAMIIDPSTILGYRNREELNLFGLVTYRLLLQNSSNGVSKIRIYFSESVPSSMEMYVFDPFSGLSRYSSHFKLSQDRMSGVLELKDGDYGDADGIKNGIIVNSGSIVLSSKVGDALTKQDNSQIIKILSNVDESQACFIQSAFSEK